MSVLTGLLFGLAPAIQVARVDVSAALKAGSRNAQGEGGLGSAGRRLRGLLVVAEVAISLVLLVGAGLLVRSYIRLQDVSPGFEPDGVVSMRLGATAHQLESREAVLAFYRPLSDALAAVPGVAMRGAVSSLPFTTSVGWGSIHVEGWTPQPGQELQVDLRSATMDYFRTMSIPLMKGRPFTDADLPATADPVAIIDEPFARRFWPKGDAIGKRVWFDPDRKMTIVGVVGAVKQYALDIDGRIVVYLPGHWGTYQVARTSSDPAMVARAMARKIHEIDPTITVFDVQTMTERMSASMARRRFSTLMLGTFAGFALILAIVGLYGVLSHLVAQGTHDIGVRMALGAQRRRILIMVLRRSLVLTGSGIVGGLLGAAALTRVMANLLFGVNPGDLVTFTIVPLILVATAMLASYIPARRATRVDPVVALRDE